MKHGYPPLDTRVNTPMTAFVVVAVVVFLTCEDFGRMSDDSFPACAFFLFFFFKVEISVCTLNPLLMPGIVHSGSAS